MKFVKVTFNATQKTNKTKKTQQKDEQSNCQKICRKYRLT